MDRLRLRLHLHLILLALAPGLAACGEDLTEVPDSPATERACARPYAWGHWDDGTKRVLGTDRHVCLCMTEEEYESGSRLDEINAMLLQVCDEQAKSFDFDWTECQSRHDERFWIGEQGELVTWPTDHVINPPGSSVHCR